MFVAVESQPDLAKSRTVMRYEVVEVDGSFVLRDLLLDGYCAVPDESGRLALLRFVTAYDARLWLMRADTRRAYAASVTRTRAEAGEKPRAEDVPLLAFDLYLPRGDRG
ncbi:MULTISPECIES: hypothetical protein [Kitasatospora]|uniref:Uncharacterized protein n=1 Tax=Kitasatospora setae (strain ATCC 33774 / DSM 43861 / JCM 3304 / KCC A-0304 / NBRC 14216 / KM-6054) TaxID=452652 RepID=E4N2I2_KITSK|nr:MULTISPECIES: hypothetical protein [Kitasatospora]BAJ32366.1 hypothetical protein KSE_66070 [Kitasatospora setae KM-6054]